VEAAAAAAVVVAAAEAAEVVVAAAEAAEAEVEAELVPQYHFLQIHYLPKQQQQQQLQPQQLQSLMKSRLLQIQMLRLQQRFHFYPLGQSQIQKPQPQILQQASYLQNYFLLLTVPAVELL
jgi:hypothetical protein